MNRRPAGRNKKEAHDKNNPHRTTQISEAKYDDKAHDRIEDRYRNRTNAYELLNPIRLIAARACKDRTIDKEASANRDQKKWALMHERISTMRPHEECDVSIQPLHPNGGGNETRCQQSIVQGEPCHRRRLSTGCDGARSRQSESNGTPDRAKQPHVPSISPMSDTRHGRITSSARVVELRVRTAYALFSPKFIK